MSSNEVGTGEWRDGEVGGRGDGGNGEVGGRGDCDKVISERRMVARCFWLSTAFSSSWYSRLTISCLERGERWRTKHHWLM